MGIQAPAEVKFALIYEAIQHDDNALSISYMCQIAGVSRSGFYTWMSAAPARQKREDHDKADFALILDAYRFRGYAKGARSIHMRLLHVGIIMNVKKIRRLMNKYNLFCPIRKANPYRRMAKALATNNVAPNVVNREFKQKPRSLSLKVDFVIATVGQLVAEHGSTLDNESIVHSDQGAHYTSYAFIQKLKDEEFVQSMSRRGNCWDNAPQESFFGHMKDEICEAVAGCIIFEDVVAKVDDWIDYYNNDRYQWDLLKLSPKEYYQYLQTGVYPLPVYDPKKQ